MFLFGALALYHDRDGGADGEGFIRSLAMGRGGLEGSVRNVELLAG